MYYFRVRVLELLQQFTSIRGPLKYQLTSILKL